MIKQKLEECIEWLSSNGVDTRSYCVGGQGKDTLLPSIRVAEGIFQAVEISVILLSGGYKNFFTKAVTRYETSISHTHKYIEIEFWSDVFKNSKGKK